MSASSSQSAGDDEVKEESPVASTATAATSSLSTSALPTDLRLSNVLACFFPDDLSRHILQLLLPFAGTPHLELEGKLGRCVLPATQQKPAFPQLLDCLLPLDSHSSQHVFEAAVPMRVFRHLNDGVMKGRVEREQEDSRRERRAARLSYSHPVSVDLFYSAGPTQTRVSVDSNSGARTAITKRKLNHIDFLSPSLASYAPTTSTATAAAPSALPPSIDFRLSLSQEEPAALPVTEPFRIRKKDRRSYGGEWWQVDCTVVETWDRVGKDSTGVVGWAGVGKPVVTYEVELELVGGAIRRVREEAAKAATGKDNSLLDIARNFLDNMRSLSILAMRPLPPSCIPRAATAATATSSGVDSRKRNREEMEEIKENHK